MGTSTALSAVLLGSRAVGSEVGLRVGAAHLGAWGAHAIGQHVDRREKETKGESHLFQSLAGNFTCRKGEALYNLFASKTETHTETPQTDLN